MMAFDDLLATISTLQLGDLERWINEELVTPQQDGEALVFSDIECARVRLICSLTYELDIDGGTLPLVLSLLDRLTRQAGKNLIMVTHSAESAALADRMYELHGGKIVGHGPGSLPQMPNAALPRVVEKADQSSIGGAT